MKIGYARVSTDEQNLDLQIDALKADGCEKIFSDEGVSGITIKRDGLDQAISATGENDILVVWKLDRLGRSLAFLIDLTETLRQNGCGFKSLSDGIDTTTAAGKLYFHMMGAIAEFERSLISDRTKAGMKSAKKRGRSIGRKKVLTIEQISHAKAMIEAGKETKASMARLFGVDWKTLHRALLCTT